MPNTIGVVSAPAAAYVETLDRTMKLEKNAMLLTSEGTVAEDTDFDTRTEFSVKGKGALPDGIAAGSHVASDNSILVGASAGVTVIPEVTESDKATGYNEWNFTARNYPSAA